MAVEVRIPTVFRKLTAGASRAELGPGTIGDLISQLDHLYPGFEGQVLAQGGELHRFVNIYLNDEDVRYLEGLETKAAEGDIVSLLPSVAGGA